jgi:hypothetical protein
MERLALGAGHRSTRDRPCLASCWLSPVLDLEGAARPTRTTGHFSRGSRSDPQDVPGESELGAPRVHGELLKLGIKIAESSVSKYMVRCRNHARSCTGGSIAIVESDLYAIPVSQCNLINFFPVANASFTRATFATDAPDTSVSSTIRRFSAMLRRCRETVLADPLLAVIPSGTCREVHLHSKWTPIQLPTSPRMDSYL